MDASRSSPRFFDLLLIIMEQILALMLFRQMSTSDACGSMSKHLYAIAFHFWMKSYVDSFSPYFRLQSWAIVTRWSSPLKWVRKLISSMVEFWMESSGRVECQSKAVPFRVFTCKEMGLESILIYNGSRQDFEVDDVLSGWTFPRICLESRLLDFCQEWSQLHP